MKNNIPNYKIDEEFSNLGEFTNYNGSITVLNALGVYIVQHWATIVFTYDTIGRKVWIHEEFISQTTSTLLGRAVRNVPNRRAVLQAIEGMSKDNARRFKAMLNR